MTKKNPAYHLISEPDGKEGADRSTHPGVALSFSLFVKLRRTRFAFMIDSSSVGWALPTMSIPLPVKGLRRWAGNADEMTSRFVSHKNGPGGRLDFSPRRGGTGKPGATPRVRRGTRNPQPALKGRNRTTFRFEATAHSSVSPFQGEFPGPWIGTRGDAPGFSVSPLRGKKSGSHFVSVPCPPHGQKSKKLDIIMRLDNRSKTGSAKLYSFSVPFLRG